ncbi:MAG: hypothetical protein Q8942_17735 [Bacillota bacterium]|nr:hypothetical protein [Bacillota bacterium]
MKTKIGPGSLSLPLFLTAIFFSIKIGRTFCPGDILLKNMGIGKTSIIYNRIFISLLFLIAGFVLGIIFRRNEGANFGKWLCLILGGAMIINILTVYFFGIDLLKPFHVDNFEAWYSY